MVYIVYWTQIHLDQNLILSKFVQNLAYTENVCLIIKLGKLHITLTSDVIKNGSILWILFCFHFIFQPKYGFDQNNFYTNDFFKCAFKSVNSIKS